MQKIKDADFKLSVCFAAYSEVYQALSVPVKTKQDFSAGSG